MSIKDRVGARIRAIRKAKGLTQPQLAERAERSVDAIGNLERGVSLPSFETLERLAKALDVPVKEFFDFEGGDGATGQSGDSGDPPRVELLATAAEICRGLETKELELAVRLFRGIR